MTVSRNDTDHDNTTRPPDHNRNDNMTATTQRPNTTRGPGIPPGASIAADRARFELAGLTPNGFQDRLLRPLGHLSVPQARSTQRLYTRPAAHSHRARHAAPRTPRRTTHVHITPRLQAFARSRESAGSRRSHPPPAARARARSAPADRCRSADAATCR